MEGQSNGARGQQYCERDHQPDDACNGNVGRRKREPRRGDNASKPSAARRCTSRCERASPSRLYALASPRKIFSKNVLRNTLLGSRRIFRALKSAVVLLNM